MSSLTFVQSLTDKSVGGPVMSYPQRHRYDALSSTVRRDFKGGSYAYGWSLGARPRIVKRDIFAILGIGLTREIEEQGWG